MKPGYTLPFIYDVGAIAQASSLHQFLTRINSPSVLVFPGSEPGRCRVLVTLLHGNEPSGLAAVMAVAQSRLTPRVTCYVIVASVAAAATPPLFSHRMLPGQPDLNRCFAGKGDSKTQVLAKAILSAITALQPECVIDLHNTSGSGPDFCVSTQDSSHHRALAACFTSRMIVTDIQLGALMEQPLGCPVVTIEAGGAQDATAVKVAQAGLTRLLTQRDIYVPHQPVQVLKHPRRLELKEGFSIAYLSAPDCLTDVCVRDDIEKYNTGLTPAGTFLGWLGSNSLMPLTLDSEQSDISAYFVAEEGKLLTRVALHIFMATTSADIARSDCLLYFIPAGRVD